MKIRMIGLPVIAAIAVTAVLAVTGCEQAQEIGEPGLQTVDSSTFSHVGYDPASQELTVVFREGGETYVYKNVGADVYEGLMAAESIGAFYHQNIRDQFEFDRP